MIIKDPESKIIEDTKIFHNIEQNDWNFLKKKKNCMKNNSVHIDLVHKRITNNTTISLMSTIEINTIINLFDISTIRQIW